MSAAVKWTEEQRRVIDQRDSNILVSAAAGSGKTAVLCERIIERLTDDSSPLSLDRLLVMTFTRAAAEELRERISKALRERIVSEEEWLRAEDDASEEAELHKGRLSHLRRQRLLLRGADISTIDSLCQKLIREYYQDLDIDPSFRVAEEGELKLIRADVMEELLEESYGEAEEGFLEFAESHSSRQDDGKLSELINSAYDFIQSEPWPKLSLERMLEESRREEQGDFESLKWFREMCGSIAADAAEYKGLLEDALELCGEPDGPSAYEDNIKELMAFSGSLHEEASADPGRGSYERLYRLIGGFAPARLKAVRSKDTDPQKKASAKQVIDSFKDWIKELRAGLFALPPELTGISIKGSAGYIGELLKLTGEFMDRFAAAKREKNVVDFGDLEHLCLEVLYDRTENGVEPSAIADELSRRYDEILVDEYQDSNMVQEELIRALSGERFGRPDVFMVGDVKQSIYGFRLARPELFMSKYESYKKAGDPGAVSADESSLSEERGVRIELNRNFRSRQEVISAVNEVFYPLMKKDLGGIDYDEEARLYKGAEMQEAPDISYDTELCIMDTEAEDESGEDSLRAPSSNDEYEALLAASIIKELVNEKDSGKSFKVMDRESGELRPARYGDIAILMRSPGSRGKTYVDILGAAGIPAYTEAGSGYFSAAEVELMLSFLNIIDNPRQDIDLAAVMRSMIGGFSDEDLARLRIRARDESGATGDLYDDLKICAVSGTDEGSEGRMTSDMDRDRELSGLCRDFLSMLEGYRRLSDMLPVSRLLDRIYSETGYYDYVSVLPLGKTRKKNLDMLMKRAEDYASSGERSIFGFVRYIELLKKYNSDYGEASAVSGAEDTVRIVSIHRSKGLEYPIVILANMEKRFNLEDRKESVLMDSRIGMGADYVDLKDRIRYPGLKRELIKQHIKEEDLAEELRILYVAMTRAREKLIMTAAMKDAGTKLEKYAASSGLRAKDGRIPRVRLLKASSFLELIFMSGAVPEGSVELKRTALHELEDIELSERADREGYFSQLSGLDPREVPDPDCLTDIKRSMKAVYAYDEETRLRPKTSVSELKEGIDLDDAAFSLEEETGSGTAIYMPFSARGGKPSGGYFLGDASSEDTSSKDYSLESHAAASVQKSSGTSGTDAGNSFHRFMELVDIKGLLDIRELLVPRENSRTPDNSELSDFVDRELRRIEKQGLMDEEQLGLIQREDIEFFLGTDTALCMADAAERGSLFREQRFMVSFPARELDPSAATEAPQLLQGIIDVYFEKDGELIILDYKTDRRVTPEILRERYGMQLGLYKKALEKLTAKKVRSCLIYSTWLGSVLEL